MRRSQNISRRDFLKASAASVGLVGLGVSAAHGASQTVRTGGVLRYAHNTDILNFDPTQLPAGNFAMLYTLYDTLIRFDEKYKATPQLAESWEFGDGGKRLTMRLRKGVTFHRPGILCRRRRLHAPALPGQRGCRQSSPHVPLHQGRQGG